MNRNADRFVRVSAMLGLAALFAMVTSPVWANGIPIPEPATMGMFAAGVGAAYVIHRLGRRK